MNPDRTPPRTSVVLDGGMASELERRGHDLSDALWSARLLLDDPDEIEEVHLAYFRAGAQVATTASYQATIPGFAAAGLDRATALKAISRSVELAGRARDRFAAEAEVNGEALLIAGSIGPYGAMRADGSEYRGDYDPGRGTLREVHAPRMDALMEAGADLLAIETIPTMREARVLVDLLTERGGRAWISYQCRDGSTTAAGEPFGEAVALAAGSPAVIAVGVNCTAPSHVNALLRIAADATDRPLIAYPNAGDRWDTAARSWVTTDARTPPLADARWWIDIGARWVGGCCGVGPDAIAELARTIVGAPAA